MFWDSGVSFGCLTTWLLWLVAFSLIAVSVMGMHDSIGLLGLGRVSQRSVVGVEIVDSCRVLLCSPRPNGPGSSRCSLPRMGSGVDRFVITAR